MFYLCLARDMFHVKRGRVPVKNHIVPAKGSMQSLDLFVVCFCTIQLNWLSVTRPCDIRRPYLEQMNGVPYEPNPIDKKNELNGFENLVDVDYHTFYQ